MYGSGAVSCSCSLLIRGPNLARCQAEAPLIALCRFSKPALCSLGLLRSEYSRFATLGFIDAENLFRQPGPRQEPGQTMTAGRSDCGRLLCPTSRRAPA